MPYPLSKQFLINKQPWNHFPCHKLFEQKKEHTMLKSPDP